MMNPTAQSGIALAALAISAAALVATSKAPITASADGAAVVDFALEAGETRQYTAEITHTDLGNASGSTNVYVSASVAATDAETTLALSVLDTGDTGTGTGTGTSAGAESTADVDADGLTITANSTFGLDTSPTITLIAGDTGGVEGTLTADTIVEWFAESSEPLSVSVVLVEVAE